MNRVLMIESAALSSHEMRVATRRAGVGLLYETADRRERYLRLLARAPELVVTTLAGLPDMSFEELAKATHAAQVPVVVVGGDTAEEREVLTRDRSLYMQTCRLSRLAWLPALLDRLVRDAADQARRKLREETEQASANWLRAADQVREVQKLATVGRLTGSIAHEINNPLESITNLMYLMTSDDQFPEHMRPYLDLAQSELQRVAQISRQTLNFCRETQSMVRVQVSSLLDEVLALYTRRIYEKHLDVERQFGEEQAVVVFPGEMRQVYSNLIANAIEASEPGGRLVVRIHRSRRWNGKAVDGMRVLVSDNGCGIPDHVRTKLGQPFYTTKGQSGTGLGLWVSRSILQRYGAEMRLRSSIAPAYHGTTFSVFVPFVHRARVVEMALVGSKPGEASPVIMEPVDVVRLRASSS
jgi:signal transduction histidine kinase